MIVLFKQTPSVGKKANLRKLIESALKRSLLYKLSLNSDTIVDMTMLNLSGDKGNLINAYSIVPDNVASIIIDRLDRMIVNGRRISVREYKIRSEQNDPRKFNGNVPQDIVDKRIEDRRQYATVPC